MHEQHASAPLDRRFLLGGLAGAAGMSALAAMTSRAAAGPLNPPPGAVASSAKPLAEVEPRTAVNATNTPGDANSVYKISLPGSYYLTGNVQGVAGKSGIEIASGGVTLDLMGFSVIGTGSGVEYGINTSGSSLSGVTVRNGVVRGWAANGIEFSGTTDSPHIEGIHAVSNGGIGINTGPGSRVLNCTVESNASIGMIIGAGSAAEGCVARDNVGVGIQTSSGCSLRGCVASLNDDDGFSLGINSAAYECVSYNNSGTGFVGSSAAVLSCCTAYSNTGNGATIGSYAHVSGCNMYANGFTGVLGYDACLITGCHCRANGSSGCSSGDGSVITDNLCHDNSANGTGAGVQITADGRVEGNTCRNNFRGILALGAGNIIARNACSVNNNNWNIAANNFVAPIIECPVSPAISGSTGGAGLGTTNAHANFTY